MISILISPAGNNRDLVVELQRIEANIVKWPQISITQSEPIAALDDAIDNLFGYDWLLLKNASAARCFLERFTKLNHSLHELDDLRLCVIGDQAAEVIRDSQLHIDVEIGSANAVFATLEDYVGGRASLSGLNLLVPSANMTGEKFQREFEETGARFDRITAYRTTSDPYALAQLNALLVGGGIDFVFFKTGGEIEELAQLFDTQGLETILRETAVICADQTTRMAARDFGLADVFTPSEPTTDALLGLISSSST
jgi:uroporphyrinogen-III synthase